MTVGRLVLLIVLSKSRCIYVAERVKVQPSTVSRWSSGQRLPRTQARLRLAAVYGIPIESWGMRI